MRIPLLAACLLGIACGGLRAADPRPSAEEQARFLAEAREMALNYTSSLPDFLCTQTIRRYTAPWGACLGARCREVGVSSIPDMPKSLLRDTLTVEVSLENHSDRYALTEVNRRPASMDYADLDGTTTTGEFGNLLPKVFGGAAEFHFNGWTTVNKRRAARYSFRLKPSDTPYQLTYRDPYTQQRISVTAGLHGDLVIDRDTHTVIRIEYSPDPVVDPFPFVVRSAVEYENVRIGDRSYWLPVKSVLRSGSANQSRENIVEFHSYRKFTSESRLKFEAPAPE